MCIENFQPFNPIWWWEYLLESGFWNFTIPDCLKMNYMNQSYSIYLMSMRMKMTYQNIMANWIQINVTITNFPTNWLQLLCGRYFNKYLSRHHMSHDVNEDENDISEYHGDLDPDKCYCNQFSHNLIAITLWKIFQWIFKSPSHSRQFISLLHFNVRSVPPNLSYFLSYINNLNHDFSVIGLSKTRVKQSNISAYGIDGYSHISLTRSNGMGGGISLVISDEFVFCELNEYSVITENI